MMKGRKRSMSLHRIEPPEEDTAVLEPVRKRNIKIDLQIESNEDLRDAIIQIQRQLKDRKESLEGHKNIELIKKQFSHIQEQFADGNKYVSLSLEHLELYQRYLLRLDEGLPKELEDERTGLLKTITKTITGHALSKLPRSGDVVGAQGGGYFKVTAGRRRQMCATLHINFFTGPALFALYCYLLWRFLQPYSIYVASLYVTYIFLDNMLRPMPSRGRVCQCFRKGFLFRLFRDYFPIRLMKAASDTEFDPQGNYLFCYHPHGVQSAGAFSCSSNATNWDKIFPGINLSVQTLNINFKIPITRELLIMLGVGNASKASLTKALNKKTPGTSALLVTGGAKEAMYAHPHFSKLVLKTRKGFVKMALRTGASLVPMYGFGENNLYENLAVESQRIRYWQRRIQRILTFAPLLVAGRGVFSYSGGFIPHRRPISVVVGEPIPVGQPVKEPSQKQIDEVHAKYKEAVIRIFETYKGIYDPKAEPIEFV